jgi:dTDP-4-dehydrorhamnose 3,5-epimerase
LIIDRYFERCELLRLNVKGDERGSLIALEGGLSLPFEVARVYYIYGTLEGVARGFHAHRDLHQLAICVSGSCTMIIDDGRERRAIKLDRPDHGLSIGPMLWREMHDFSRDCVLLVLASRPYDEADYIRDYDDFVALATAGANG